MTQPLFSEYVSLTNYQRNGLIPNNLFQRYLVCLAVLASGQNPDGTPYTQ